MTLAYMLGVGYPANRPSKLISKPDWRPFDEVVHRGRWYTTAEPATSGDNLLVVFDDERQPALGIFGFDPRLASARRAGRCCVGGWI